MRRARRWWSRAGATALSAFVAFGVVGTVPAPLVGSRPASAAVQKLIPIREMQWYLDALQIPDAHKISKGAGVVVAVIDNGVEASHRDLVGQILPGHGFGSLAGTDGRQDKDKVGHGTRMAGIIAAKGGGPDHALGIAPEAKILPVNIGLPNVSAAAIHDAIHWAVDNGATVISMSFGSAEGGSANYRGPETEAVKYALDHNVVVVAASGNTDNPDAPGAPDDVDTPADIPGVVAVAAVNQNAEHLNTSIYGPEVVLAAPGEQIASPAPLALAESGYAYGGQTSSATAIVAGVVALIRSHFPSMDAKNVVNRLIASARDQGAPGRDPLFGFGTVRPLKALSDDIPLVDAWPLPTPSGSATTTRAGGAAAGGAIGGSTALLIGAGACLLVVVLIVVLVTVLLVSRSRRRRREAARVPVGAGLGPPPGYPQPPPGYGPAPPGYGQGSPGYGQGSPGYGQGSPGYPPPPGYGPPPASGYPPPPAPPGPPQSPPPGYYQPPPR